MESKRLVLFDGSNIIKRGYYAVPAMSSDDGTPTNAVKGAINIVGYLIKNLSPSHAAFVLDHPSKTTFRHLMYPKYKANRPTQQEVDAALRPQRTIIKSLLKACGIRVICKKGIEADDIIGTLAHMDGPFDKRLIVSQDKDFAQLLCEGVYLLKYNHSTKKYTSVNMRNCQEHFSVPHDRIVEYLMLLGDTVDNIPGVKGVGNTTAQKILLSGPLKDYKSSGVNPSYMRYIDEAKSQFKLARKLITIKKDVIDIAPASLKRRPPDFDRIAEICDSIQARGLHANLLKYLNNK